MYCIGLTGYMGSGKSTVAFFFAKLGVAVIHADHIAKELTAPNQQAYHKIVHHFGESILTENQELNRPLLRKIIFSKSSERQWLEDLLHPMIRKAIEKKITQVKSPYCLIEIPLLVDKTHYPYLNRILVVQAEAAKQVARCMLRDNSSKEAILEILETQQKHHQLAFNPDDLIINDGTIEELHHKISELHKKYIKYAENNI